MGAFGEERQLVYRRISTADQDPAARFHGGNTHGTTCIHRRIDTGVKLKSNQIPSRAMKEKDNGEKKDNKIAG